MDTTQTVKQITPGTLVTTANDMGFVSDKEGVLCVNWMIAQTSDPIPEPLPETWQIEYGVTEKDVTHNADASPYFLIALPEVWHLQEWWKQGPAHFSPDAITGYWLLGMHPTETEDGLVWAVRRRVSWALHWKDEQHDSITYAWREFVREVVDENEEAEEKDPYSQWFDASSDTGLSQSMTRVMDEGDVTFLGVFDNVEAAEDEALSILGENYELSEDEDYDDEGYEDGEE